MFKLFGHTQSTQSDNSVEVVMPFGEHLEELRTRLIFALLGTIPILLVALSFSKQLLGFIIAPALKALASQGLPALMLQTSPPETFLTTLKLAIVVTVLVGSPWLLYQTWLFVAPGLHSNEKRFVYILIPLSTLLTATGMVFLYEVLLPLVLSFFIGFGSSFAGSAPARAALPEGTTLPSVPVLQADPFQPEPGQMWVNSPLRSLRIAVPNNAGNSSGKVIVLGMPMSQSSGIVQQYRISEYTSMFLSLALALSLGFQTPVVVLLLGWVGIIEPTNLLKYRRHLLLVSFVLGAVLTPADPLSMILVAAPIYALFELGVLLHRLLPAERVARGFGRSHRAKAHDTTNTTKEGPDAGDE